MNVIDDPHVIKAPKSHKCPDTEQVYAVTLQLLLTMSSTDRTSSEISSSHIHREGTEEPKTKTNKHGL